MLAVQPQFESDGLSPQLMNAIAQVARKFPGQQLCLEASAEMRITLNGIEQPIAYGRYWYDPTKRSVVVEAYTENHQVVASRPIKLT